MLALFVCVYFPVAAMALGAEDPYLDLSPIFYNPQRLMLLVALLWLLRGSTGAWRRLYDELALAMAVFHGVGLLSNRALFGGTYRPGLYDLPWALPFLWIALAARDWAARPRELPVAPDPDPPGWDDRDWQAARQGNIVAIGAVALVPAVHQLAILLGSPPPALAQLRSHIALGGTLLVGGLYLARQLHTLRRAENTQQVREERFRALVENSADAIGVVDAQGLFRYVSATSERVTGYRPDELVGRSPLELAQAGERPELGGALLELRASPGSRAGRAVRYQHRDGSLRHGALEIVNRLETPAVSGVVLHLRDVTEQRRAEEERGRSLLAARGDAGVDGRRDPGGRARRPDHALQSEVRRNVAAPARAAGRGGRRALDPLRAGSAAGAPGLPRPARRELYAEPESEGFDTLRLRDGRVIERYSLPQRLAGEVMGRVYSFRDVSERARAEQAMARLVAILEATPDLVGTSDAAGRALYLNRAGRRMLGIGDDEPLGDRHIAQFHPAPAAARVLEEAIPTALRDGAWSGESRLRRADGREIPVLQVVLAHRSPHGEVEFLSTLARDISQRIEAERELRRSHTMAALGSLVAGVAHEVRNPLFGISSTLDAFEARFTGQDDHREYVRALPPAARPPDPPDERPARVRKGDPAAARSRPLRGRDRPRARGLRSAHVARRGGGRHADRARPARAADGRAAAQPGAAQPAGERGPALPERRHGQRTGRARERRGRRAGSSARSRTTAPASRSRTCPTCSSRSSPAATAGPGSASRSCSASSPTTAAASRRATARPAAPASGCGCRRSARRKALP